MYNGLQKNDLIPKIQTIPRGPIYYWIVSRLNGKLVIVGPKRSEQEANEFGYSKLNDLPFEVVGLQTRDRSKATASIKALVLEKTADLEASIRRASHQIPGGQQ